MTWPHPLTHPSTQPPTPPMGGGVSTNHKSPNRIELSSLGQHLLNFSDLTWSHPSTHPPTHPSNYTPTYGWGILHRFQIFKRNWNILIRSSVIKILPIPRVPRGGWQMGGWGGDGYGCVGDVPCTHTCTCMLACMHMHVKHDKHGCLHVGGHLQFLYMCLHACVCVHMHVCVCVWWHPWPPQMPPDTPHPPALSPELQGAENTKI